MDTRFSFAFINIFGDEIKFVLLTLFK